MDPPPPSNGDDYHGNDDGEDGKDDEDDEDPVVTHRRTRMTCPNFLSDDGQEILYKTEEVITTLS